MLLLYWFGNILILSSLDTSKVSYYCLAFGVRLHQHTWQLKISFMQFLFSRLLIANDADVSPYFQVIIPRIKNVTAAEHRYSSSRYLEQISCWLPVRLLELPTWSSCLLAQLPFAQLTVQCRNCRLVGKENNTHAFGASRWGCGLMSTKATKKEVL